MRLGVSFHHPLSTVVKITTSNPHFSLAREKLSPLLPSSLSGQLACCCCSRGHSMGRQLLLPHCYQNTPYQEHPGAPSLSPNPRILVRIGLLGFAQVGPGTNYESVGRRFERPKDQRARWNRATAPDYRCRRPPSRDTLLSFSHSATEGAGM